MEKEESYAGEERRVGYCPVHKLKCEQWSDTAKQIRTRVPIWVFVLAVGIIGGAMSWLNVESAKRHERAQIIIGEHVIDASEELERTTRELIRTTNLMGDLIHSHAEVALNQRSVMKKLELPFQHIPRYGGYDGEKR